MRANRSYQLLVISLSADHVRPCVRMVACARGADVPAAAFGRRKKSLPNQIQNSANDPSSGSAPSKFNSLGFTPDHVTDHLITK
jgi:hypothetical protein